MLALCLGCLGSGAWLWVRANRPLEGRVKSSTTGLFMLMALVLTRPVLARIVRGALRLWAPGVFLFALTVLLITVIAPYFYQSA